MPTRDQVAALLAQGLAPEEIGRRLGIPAGQVHLIGTGVPADGSDAFTSRERDERGVLGAVQHLLGVPVRNPTSREAVHDWIRRRVAQDPAMRAAQHRNDEQQEGE
ncbi:hypothetical protein GCM10010472_21600 [Pseudonocardia halophobica]|uniref:Uncharacterized protein n=1 Tax=Pseudonocardia halophobica TaxID=29401 RepID=A0A9W6KWK0_9PSEU|nr:hypothetical protein [Pseudonocardia halophobica]GLL09392.1 hypothetical protein GCM10017577_05320 [Pseudonocardia halophobica]